ncbi:MAG: hypothetical protein ACR2N9_11140 [Acidimicrobiia bacterium]
MVRGCEAGPEFRRADVELAGRYNPVKMENDIVTVAKQMIEEHDIGSILLECTELSPHAVAVQEVVHMPVWDYTTLTEWIYAGAVRRPFVGHM